MSKSFKSNLCLLTTAVIWGFALVPQRDSMDVMGPFMYSAIRMFLGSAALVPFFIIGDRLKKKNRVGHEASENGALPDAETMGRSACQAVSGQAVQEREVHSRAAGNQAIHGRAVFISFRGNKELIKGGVIAGIIVFFSVNFQQAALISTSAGKTAFITALYIVLVPIFGIFLKRKANINNWIGAFLGAAGLFFLCVTSDFTIAAGDITAFAGALGWVAQIYVIDYYAPKVDAAKLISIQFFVGGVLSLAAAFALETNTVDAVISSIPSLLYTGVMSSGIAYTLQAIGQKNADPAAASVILSTESLFGALSGFIFLNEVMTGRELLGCVLMMAAVIIAQLPVRKKAERYTEKTEYSG